MEYTYLSENVKIKTVLETETKGTFEIEGLYTGYGLTVGNTLRRALLSSLPGAAVTQFKVMGVPHEFASLPGVKEDVIELSLNLKNLRFRMHTDEPRTLTLKGKGQKELAGGDIATDDTIEVVNPKAPIATLTGKDAAFEAELTVEKGLGYSPADSRNPQKLPIGVVAIDALFSPVQKVNYTIENMRVGARTDYDRLRVDIETDGTIAPSVALHKAANILRDHFDIISGVGGLGDTSKKAAPQKEEVEEGENEAEGESSSE